MNCTKCCIKEGLRWRRTASPTLSTKETAFITFDSNSLTTDGVPQKVPEKRQKARLNAGLSIIYLLARS